MNEAQRINNDIGRTSTTAGLIVLGIVLVVFLYNSLTGYVKVTKDDTYDNCTVNTWHEQRRNSKGGTYNVYYLKIYQEVSKYADIDFNDLYKTEEPLDQDIYNSKEIIEKNDLFFGEVPYLYYSKFNDYDSKKITIFKTDWGRSFPVYKQNCSAAEAEREYRRLDPPIFWYTAYGACIMLALVLISAGKKAKRTANNYSENFIYENKPDTFSTTEDALAAMATMRIRREKAEMRNSRRNNRYPF